MKKASMNLARGASMVAIGVAVVWATILFIVPQFEYTPAAENEKESLPDRDTVRVARVIDGDTFVTEDSVRVRVLGIDCPELNEDLGWLARAFVVSLTVNQDVVLVYDSGREDIWGRTRAYVMRKSPNCNHSDFTVGDTVDIGAWLLHAGLAKVTKRYQFERKAKYIMVELEARRRKMGMWKE